MKIKLFEWYVLNHNFNDDKIAPYNIFNNLTVLRRTNELCKEYKQKRMTFEDFTDKLRSIIMCEEWSRCEYEIFATGLFGDGEAQKIDCYMQALPNIKIIAKYVLEEYYPNLKIKIGVKEEDPLVYAGIVGFDDL